MTDVANITAANAVAVMVTAEMPAFVKTGQRLDVTISAIERSLFEEVSMTLYWADGELMLIKAILPLVVLV